MFKFMPLPILAAAATFLSSALATFDISASTNMAVYWVSPELVGRDGVLT